MTVIPVGRTPTRAAITGMTTGWQPQVPIVAVHALPTAEQTDYCGPLARAFQAHGPPPANPMPALRPHLIWVFRMQKTCAGRFVRRSQT